MTLDEGLETGALLLLIVNSILLLWIYYKAENAISKLTVIIRLLTMQHEPSRAKPLPSPPATETHRTEVTQITQITQPEAPGEAPANKGIT